MLFSWMTLPGLLASCARQDKKDLTLSYVLYPYLKSHAVWAFYLSHTENDIEKTGEGGGAFNELESSATL